MLSRRSWQEPWTRTRAAGCRAVTTRRASMPGRCALTILRAAWHTPGTATRMQATHHMAEIYARFRQACCQRLLITTTLGRDGRRCSCRRRQAWPYEQPAAEAAIVVA